MEAEITKLALSQGLFAALFVALLFWVLRDGKERENRLMSFFDKMSDKLSDIQCNQERGFVEITSRLDRILNHVRED